MMHHIDVSSVLRQTLACDLYSNLVTRSTGAAVRGQIELLLGESPERAYAVIDFSQVSMIDFSCADEVVAKLLIRYAADDSPQEAYFLFRGVNEDHRYAIESALERHGLALAIEQADGVSLLGVLTDVERRAWDAAYRLGPVDAVGIAREIGAGGDETQATLDELGRRRLLMHVDGQYLAVGGPRGGRDDRPEAQRETIDRPLRVASLMSTRASDAERGPMVTMHPADARSRLLNDGELAWVYGSRRHELATVRIEEGTPFGEVVLRDIVGAAPSEIVRVIKPDFDKRGRRPTALA